MRQSESSKRGSSSGGGGGGGNGDGDGGCIIGRLPEECISHSIALTSPRDACRSAAVSTSFRSAANSDVVWRRFLPPDYESFLARALAPVEYASKRELFFRLCDRPVLIDDGNLSFALDKFTGKKCFMLSARKLTIIWGNTTRYWRWIQLPDSRFAEVAKLLDVCWLEIRGKIESRMLSPETNYAAFLVYKLSDNRYGLNQPNQEASVNLGAYLSTNMVRLEPVSRRTETYRMGLFNMLQNEEENVDAWTPETRGDGWMEIKLGEFYNVDGEDGEVGISFMEVRGGNWKKGLLIQGIEIRPKM